MRGLSLKQILLVLPHLFAVLDNVVPRKYRKLARAVVIICLAILALYLGLPIADLL
jgi:hypothetical protein